MKIDKDLLAKYNVPLPRYTSYPPANHFTDDFTSDDYRNLLVKSNENNPQHISFYIHIPFCDRICFYCGCNATRLTGGVSVDKYIDSVKKEIEIVSSYIDKNRKVSQIHYGGGTPNAIDAKYLVEINNILFEKFSFIEDPEIAIECHPALLDDDYLVQLYKAGFNRFSFGIQDFNEDVLRNVNRRPSAIPIGELIGKVKSENSKFAVNLDFMYGLPGQTTESLSETIKQAIEVRPDRLVTFSYAHVPWMKEHQKILDKRGLPSPEAKMEMFLVAYNLLKEAGYVSIGLDHYALPNDELSIALQNHQLNRNFQGYCTRRTTGQVYAFGVSGISQLAGGYAQNTKDIFKYYNTLIKNELPVEKGYKLSEQENIIKEIITELMCNKFLDWKRMAEKFDANTISLKKIVNYNKEKLAGFEKDKLLDFDENIIQVSEKGGLFIRNIATSLDPVFVQVENKYSKSV